MAKKDDEIQLTDILTKITEKLDAVEKRLTEIEKPAEPAPPIIPKEDNTEKDPQIEKIEATMREVLTPHFKKEKLDAMGITELQIAWDLTRDKIPAPVPKKDDIMGLPEPPSSGNAANLPNVDPWKFAKKPKSISGLLSSLNADKPISEGLNL